jgi:hypothetical protein
MASERASQRAFFGVSALLFAASTTVYDFAEDQERIRLMQNALGPIDHVVQRTEELRNG